MKAGSANEHGLPRLSGEGDVKRLFHAAVEQAGGRVDDGAKRVAVSGITTALEDAISHFARWWRDLAAR